MLNGNSTVPLPVQLSAELHRRYPTAWKRFDEARAKRSGKLRAEPVTWLTHEEAFTAFAKIRDEHNIDQLPVEVVADLYACGTWRITQGLYRFDPELLRALAETPVDISLPASVLTRLPEWAVYVETQGFLHHGKPIAGMIATLFEASSGLSLMLTLIPETVVDIIDDLDRLQFHITDMPLRERLLHDIGEQGIRRDEFREIFAKLPQPGMPKETLEGPAGSAAAQTLETALNTVLNEILPFLSTLIYLASDVPDLESRPVLPIGKSTKHGVRFFPPDKPRVWPVGLRVGAALHEARVRYDEAAANTRTGVRPHWRKAHYHSFWTGSRTGNARVLKVRWLMPVAVNLNPDDVLPAVVHRVE